MSKRQNLYLLLGCLFVLALEFPLAMRQVRADWAGPWGAPAQSLGDGSQASEVAQRGELSSGMQSHLGSTPIPALTPISDLPPVDDMSSKAIVATR